MAGLVTIKSFKNGLSIYLDSEVDFSTLAEAVAEKFKEASSFFKDAQMAVSFEGRKLTDEEEMLLLDIITSNSSVNILCVIGKDEDSEEQFVKALKQLEVYEDSMAYFYKGSLTDGKKLESEENVVILGDVYPGCSIVTDKSIIVMGGLYGQAFAGRDETPGRFIAAIEMSPEKITIGGFKYKAQDKPKWSIIPKVQPKIAYESDGIIHMENITKDLLNSLPF